MSATVLSVSKVFSTQDILYPLSNNPEIDKVSILLLALSDQACEGSPPPHKLDISNDRGGACYSHFLNNHAKAQSV